MPQRAAEVAAAPALSCLPFGGASCQRRAAGSMRCLTQRWAGARDQPGCLSSLLCPDTLDQLPHRSCLCWDLQAGGKALCCSSQLVTPAALNSHPICFLPGSLNLLFSLCRTGRVFISTTGPCLMATRAAALLSWHPRGSICTSVSSSGTSWMSCKTPPHLPSASRTTRSRAGCPLQSMTGRSPMMLRHGFTWRKQFLTRAW